MYKRSRLSNPPPAPPTPTFNPSSPNTVPQPSYTPLSPSTPSTAVPGSEVTSPANEELPRTTARSRRRASVYGGSRSITGPAPNASSKKCKFQASLADRCGVSEAWCHRSAGMSGRLSGLWSRRSCSRWRSGEGAVPAGGSIRPGPGIKPSKGACPGQSAAGRLVRYICGVLMMNTTRLGDRRPSRSPRMRRGGLPGISPSCRRCCGRSKALNKEHASARVLGIERSFRFRMSVRLFVKSELPQRHPAKFHWIACATLCKLHHRLRNSCRCRVFADSQTEGATS
jgi:hypothetical protein